MGGFSLAEKEGFEPSIPFWGIHDFQSCALGQLRDFSKLFCAVFRRLCILLHLLSFVKHYFLIFGKIIEEYLLTFRQETDIISWLERIYLFASVAQSVVHLTRNEKVACSSQVTSSTKRIAFAVLFVV